MTDLVARDLQSLADQGEDPAELLTVFRQQCLAGDYRFGIALYEGRRLPSAFRPQALPLEDWQPFETANALVESITGGDARAESGFIERRLLEQALAKGRKKLTRRLKKIEQEERQAGTFEKQKICGELLLANLHRLEKGMRAVELDNYYEDPPVAVTIELDPLLTPQENAERYFRRYKKSRRGLDHLKRRVDETHEEQRWLEQLALDLDEAVTGVDLREIAEELTDAGFLPRQSRSVDPRKSPSLKDRVRKATSPSGFVLYWGRNPRTNDYVTRQLTTAADLWFHAHNIPGCHLVLKREGRSEVPDEDILHAAAVAAGYSRGQNDTRVEVMIADGRAVKKPKGARPGLVTVDRFRTVRVAPIRLPEE
ncbi:MAG: DUF814 domain-containing protein [Desulfuromonadales bacterium]|nr:DUF814 domain-containing protein [Desulfuromonadales bacterium]NIR34121.1 DUF814 domain-containing protein [Desulfuromonadales bacterium]NIS41577.1 DUF814 domain-containing protein [Desulfuromonadales bacterium]